MVQHRKWILFGVTAFLLIFSLTLPAAAESDHLEVTVVCPSQVPVGGTVVIGLEITNVAYVPVQVSKSAVVAAYPGAQVLGPYTRPFSESINPGQKISIPNYATYNISPDIPNGTLIGHGVCLFGTDFNHLLGCGGAITEVLTE